MTDNSILIIANCQSILETKLGTKIDDFNNIARINNYKIGGYEEFVGTKTDIWINGANSKLAIPDIIPERIVVTLPSKVFDKNKANILSYVSKKLNMNQNKFLLVPNEDILNYENEVDNNRLTTGLYSIMWALKNYENIYIHGFDFFINSKSHYFDSKLINFMNEKFISKGYKHDNQREYSFVNNLIKEKKIKRLTDIDD